MKKLIILYFIISFISAIINPISAQQAYDNTWVMGSKKQNEYNEKFRLFTFKFDDYQLKIELADTTKKGGIYFESSSSFSNAKGELLFSTNGLRIVDNQYNVIPNGDSLNYGEIWENNKNTGYHRSNGLRAIPYPGFEDSSALLVHQRQQFDKNLGEFGDFFCDSFYLTEVNVVNGISPKIIYKNKAFDTGYFDHFDMTKHANGRDWWVVYPDRLTNTINRTLISKYGVIQFGKQSFPNEFFNSSGIHTFTPDGSKFITVDNFHKIVVYDFDRCVGDLYNPRILLIDTTLHGYTSVSPDSRFLYISSFAYLSQIDLNETVLHLDTIAQVDFFVGIDTFYNNLTFHYAQLARDKKIYIASGGSVHYMHVIHDPNKKGKECHLEQHGIVLPAYNYNSVSHFPNIRLGPVDGSPCDTLGLNNVPLAAFRYEKDSQNLKKIDFTDLTDYEPTNWNWSFGDGNTSTDQNPVYTYKSNGTYHVCLYASNANGGSNYCKDITIGTSKTFEPWSAYNIKSFPNPFEDYIVLSLDEPLNSKIDIRLTDMKGKLYLKTSESMLNGFTTIFTGNIPNGIYILSIYQKDLGSWRSKLIKIN